MRRQRENSDDDEEILQLVPPPQSGKAKSDAIIGQRVISKTRTKYAQTFNYITEYCRMHYPDSVNEDGKLIIPMSHEHLSGFLGDMGADRPDGTIKAHTTITGYCTALKHYYKENRVLIDFETQEYFKDFHQGYKRTVAKKKKCL